MSQPVLECLGPWSTECGCNRHDHCWPRPDTGCCEDLNPENPTPERAALIERMLHVAVETLDNLSGRQFGLCPVTFRPCRDNCAQSSPIRTEWVNGQLQPVLEAGKWYNTSCGTCPTTGCSCTELCEITLPATVDSVLSVVQNGAPLPMSAFRVDDGRKLVRTDGQCWPTCQDLAADLSQPNTLGVTVLRGTPVPAGGLWAAGLFACELIKACTPGAAGDCALPANAQRIAREGVTIELEPELISGNGFRTGIPRVDSWLQSVNPYRAKLRSRVFNLDRPTARTTTWPCT